ncbi:cytochrome P450 [Paracoccus sp. MBLB3053]|uniref:Cytochrome P450 n=1 Tax=Paracoccus aurantius TaxID=3073814 RepID=A0ABU2HXZ0_9RHOB|nr:cytochrome P450 [Paracoccus sp. MBLB3053]MDS9469380.1 cytochrome P450 [Paracoccus sp. MBLB3053]
MALTIGEDGIPICPAEELAQAPLTKIDDLRRISPVVRTDANRVMALRADDVARLSHDPQLPQLPGAHFAKALGIPEGRCRAFLENFMLMSNGADHHHKRGAFAKTFSHPAIRAKRGLVRVVARQIVADLPRGEPFDFLALCASRLPAEVIAKMLGLPVQSSSWFAGQVYSFSRCLMVPYAIDRHDEIEGSAEALYRFVSAELDDRREKARDDLLSSLVQDETARALESEDLIYQVMGIILAGSDTTRSGFNLLVGRLLADRTLWEAVGEDRALIPAAIDEALRIEPPVGSLPRLVTAPVALDSHLVAPGQLLALSTLSAMRDEARLDAAQCFNLQRTDHIRPHLVFGGGPHRCLGEMLARIELEEGLAALLDDASGIELIEAPRMMGISGIRRSTPLIARIS